MRGKRLKKKTERQEKWEVKPPGVRGLVGGNLYTISSINISVLPKTERGECENVANEDGGSGGKAS